MGVRWRYICSGHSRNHRQRARTYKHFSGPFKPGAHAGIGRRSTRNEEIDQSRCASEQRSPVNQMQDLAFSCGQAAVMIRCANKIIERAGGGSADRLQRFCRRRGRAARPPQQTQLIPVAEVRCPEGRLGWSTWTETDQTGAGR